MAVLGRPQAYSGPSISYRSYNNSALIARHVTYDFETASYDKDIENDQ